VVAAVVLIALSAIIFGGPALLGHPVLTGDDLGQNYPLRVLAGQEIRSGHLPLYDPYSWSGAPLLAGWNGGAAYPLTWLFAILSGTAAWTLNLIATWVAAGLGMFCFLRALRLRSLASFLGAFSFAFAGAMSAQVTHFGLVAGMSWVPLLLLSVLRLAQERPVASRLRWTAVLGVAIGLVILAGEPRAIDDAGVIVIIYAVWQVARLGRRAGPAAASVTAGLVLGVGLAAIQWLPGLAAIATSQRGASTMALFNSGSLPARWLLLTLVPDLLGGSGSLGQPTFVTSYNLTEVTSYVGILPLVAAFALLGRLRLRPRLPEWAVWHITALTGVILALGGNTPVGNLLFRIPLFGDQRLQSRNVLVLDVALAVLLAYWADRPVAGRDRAAARDTGRLGRYLPVRRVPAETILGVMPAVAAVTVVVLALTWGTGLLEWMGVSADESAGVIGQLKPWLIPFAALGLGAAALVLAGRALGARLRSGLMTGFVVADVLVFTMLCVVEVGHGISGGSIGAVGSSGTGISSTGISSTGISSTGISSTGISSTGGGTTTAAAITTAAARPVSALGFAGRYAIYDPDLLDTDDLSQLDPPDVNAIMVNPMPSVQGYSSTVDGQYAAATGSHLASGGGQDTLAPSAVADGTLDQLDTSVLLSPAEYLVTSAADGGPAAGPAGTGRRDIAAGQQATWYLGSTLEVSTVVIPDAEARTDAAAGTQIGLLTPDGSTRWFPARAATSSELGVTLSGPVASLAVTAQVPGKVSQHQVGPVSVSEAGGSVVVADGQLAGALTPPHWTFAGFDGSFAVFANQQARPPLSIEARPGRSAAGAWITGGGGAPVEPTVAMVFSKAGARVVRSVADIPGWSATWQPAHGAATTLSVQRDGLIQAVDVPAGLGVVTWSYTPPLFRPGLVLSVAATALLLILLTVPAVLAVRNRRRCRGLRTGLRRSPR
jgi:hypothetical protein